MNKTSAKNGLLIHTTPQALNPFISSKKELEDSNIFIAIKRINHKNNQWFSKHRINDISCLACIIRNKYSFLILSSGSGFMRRPLLTRLILFLARKKNIPVYVWWGICNMIFERSRKRMGENAFIKTGKIMSSDEIKHHLTLTTKSAKDLWFATGIDKSLLTFNCTIYPEHESEAYLPDKEPIVLNVGSVQYRKGPDLFVKIAELVCKQHKTVKFIWVGGYADKETSRLIQQKGLEERVRFIGKVFPPWQWILKSSLLLFTTRSDAFGVVIIEAMARKRSVLCFEGTGPDTVVKDTGIIVPKWDIQKAASEVLNLINKPPLERVNFHAKEHYLKYYSPKEYAKRLADILHHPVVAEKKYGYVAQNVLYEEI